MWVNAYYHSMHKAIWIFWMHSPGWRTDCGTPGGCRLITTDTTYYDLPCFFIHSFIPSKLIFLRWCSTLFWSAGDSGSFRRCASKSILLSENQSFSRKVNPSLGKSPQGTCWNWSYRSQHTIIRRSLETRLHKSGWISADHNTKFILFDKLIFLRWYLTLLL